MRPPRVSPPIEVHVAASDEQQYQIAANECSEDAEVSPSSIKTDAELFIELVSDLVRAVCTVRSLVVDEIARSIGSKE